MNVNRPPEKYLLQGAGFHECLGLHFSEQAILEMIKVIFRLKNLRRAEGAAGVLAGFTQPSNGTDVPLYLDDTGNVTYWPGSLTLVVSYQGFTALPDVVVSREYLVCSMIRTTWGMSRSDQLFCQLVHGKIYCVAIIARLESKLRCMSHN